MTNKNRLLEQLRSGNEDDVYDALIDIGKFNYRDLEPEVRSFLQSDIPDLQRASIMVLGTYWQLDNFKDESFEIFSNSSGDDVRFSALLNWTNYYENTNNQQVITMLNQLLEDENEDKFVRIQSIRGMYTTKGITIDEELFKKMEYSSTYSDFEELIPWDDIKNKILNQ